MHQVGFIIFQYVVKKLLNLKQIFTKNSFKSKLKYIGEFRHALGIIGKLLKWIGFNEGGLEIFKPKGQPILENI